MLQNVQQYTSQYFFILSSFTNTTEDRLVSLFQTWTKKHFLWQAHLATGKYLHYGTVNSLILYFFVALVTTILEKRLKIEVQDSVKLDETQRVHLVREAPPCGSLSY